jgi:hypothetical protein
VKPGFAQSVTIFMVKVVGLFDDFNCFPDYARMVAAIVGYVFCFVKVNAVFCCCRVFG